MVVQQTSSLVNLISSRGEVGVDHSDSHGLVFHTRNPYVVEGWHIEVEGDHHMLHERVEVDSRMDFEQVGNCFVCTEKVLEGIHVVGN